MTEEIHTDAPLPVKVPATEAPPTMPDMLHRSSPPVLDSVDTTHSALPTRLLAHCCRRTHTAPALRPMLPL